MVRLLEDTASVRELEVIAAAMREAFAPRSEGSSAGELAADRLASLADAFPGYVLVREIHRGGQGVVYQALQKSTQRRVAIKVMRDGPFADAHDRTRFEREVQILAHLDHPHVVAVHDCGVASDRFYYVMDYIPGRPLDEYVADEEPSIDDLLRLFKAIAEAVNAAHLRGVTHRDLKPSNILVVCDDAEGTKGQRDPGTKGEKPGAVRPSVPEPRVLDFGLAKLAPSVPTADDSGVQTLAAMTISGQFVGSLPWASPEQAEGSPGKIDLRTDVYSLGVMMYQMLTGCFPYPVVGPMREVADHIQNAEPQRPRTVRRQINDEVETIVLKCLAKERERRYQSAGELARDLDRYLKGEPIEAKRASGWYVIRKTLRRYKGRVAVAGAFLALILVAAGVTFVLYQQAATAEQKARQTSGFMEGIINSDYLAKAVRGTASAKEVLDDAAKQIDEEKPDPAVEADLRHAVGRAYMTVSFLDEAEAQFRQALDLRRNLYPDGHPDLVATLNSLGECRKEQGAYAEAVKLHQEARELALRVAGEESLELAASLHHLAAAHWWLHQYDIARSMYEAALALRLKLLGGDHPEVAFTLNQLALTIDRLGSHVEAEQRFRRTLELRQRLLGPKHSSVADTLNNLALCLMNQQRFNESEPLFREAIQMNRETVGERHLHLPRMLGNLGRCLHELGNLPESERYLSDALTKKESQLGRRHPSTAKTLYDLAKLHLSQGKLPAAEQLCREALEIQSEKGLPEVAESQRLLDQILATPVP